MNMMFNIKFKDYAWVNNDLIKVESNTHKNKIVKRGDRIQFNNKKGKILTISKDLVLFSVKVNGDEIFDICHFSKIKKK